MRYNYTKEDFGKFKVTDENDDSFSILVSGEINAIVLCDLLNEYAGKIRYQEKVIEKYSKYFNEYKELLADKDSVIDVLNREKEILMKIIVEG